VNWRVVSSWCTWVILMITCNMWCLLARMLGLLGWTLQLRILQIISTWSIRTKLRILWWVEAGVCVARLSMRPELALPFTKFQMFVLQTYSFVQ
jgi:hypothetical protein